jgi:electron transport complex protein RnfG
MEGGKTTVNEPSYRRRVGYQAGLVGGMALLASALLIAANTDTKDKIAQRLSEDAQKMLAQVIPPALHNNNLVEDTFVVDSKTIYQATLGDHVNAVAFQVSEEGYSGLITLIMAVNPQGRVLGTRVISHSETPGLGDKVEAERSSWINSFEGLSFETLPQAQWSVKKDGGYFDQFTGATITPRAAVKAVREGMLFFQRHKALLLVPPAAEEAPMVQHEASNHGE